MPNSEIKNCQNCRIDFTIESEDFEFYDKIKVPPPTFCPQCRLIRRLVVRNERSLYRRACDLCAASILSMYPPGAVFPVYCPDCWISDKWDAAEYGTDYDWSKPMLQQFSELKKKVPRQALDIIDSPGSEYANFVRHTKNAYLSYSVVIKNEEVFYSKNIENCLGVYDCFDVSNSEQCYQNMRGEKNYRCVYAWFSQNCLDSAFLYNCIGCTNCFMSTNLRNQQYFFKNEPCTKEEYLRRLASIDLGSAKVLAELRQEFLSLIKQCIHKYADNIDSQDSTGNDLSHTKGAYRCFNSHDLENVRYSFRSVNKKDSMDCTNSGNNELIYEHSSGGVDFSSMVRFSSGCMLNLSDVHYVDICKSSKNLFGCVGLKNKEHHILNKRYTKEEYELLVPKITQHMNDMPYLDQKGRVYRYGEFFPIEMSVFAYNETVAQEHFPITREEAARQGYAWREQETKAHAVTKVAATLPDNIQEVDDSVLKEVIGCSDEGGCMHQCTGAFKIVPQELEFYRRMKLALPRLCPNCRHYERLAERNPLKLWKRQCMCEASHSQHNSGRCSNEFETSYAPDRPEIVYCESCYQAEII